MTLIQHLDADTPAVQYLASKDKHLAKVMAMVGPLDYQVETDGYAFLTSQIVGQMLSNKVAAVLTNRLTKLCHGKISPATISQLTAEQIHQIGLSYPKIGYIHNLTAAITKKELVLDELATLPDQEIIETLTKIKGIGNWSAKMYLIFSLDRPNVLPYEDLAFLQGYGWTYKTNDYRAKSVQKKCHKWRPYTSIAARYMYQALDLGLTKKEFHLFK